MGEAAQILWWIICLSGLVLSLAARDASSKVSLEDEFFEVVGPDHPSVASVGRLGGHVVATSFRLLREPESPLPRKVLVVLQAGEGSGPEEDYEIRLDPRGYVTLVLDWDSSLGLENTIYALSRAFLVQYAYSNFGTGAPPRMRAWPVSTVSSVAYLGLRPAQIATFAEESSAEPGPSAAALLQRELLSVPTDAVDRDGYWLWLLLRREGGMSGSTFQKLMTSGSKASMWASGWRNSWPVPARTKALPTLRPGGRRPGRTSSRSAGSPSKVWLLPRIGWKRSPISPALSRKISAGTSTGRTGARSISAGFGGFGRRKNCGA